MTRIFYFSGSGHSFVVAKAFSDTLNCEIHEISDASQMSSPGDTAVIVFPVYCQNIPTPVKHFLKSSMAEYVVLIATYGRISCGNVLQEAQELVHGTVIAGAYIPTGHTYLDSDYTFDRTCLSPIAERIQIPRPVQIPKCRKNLLSNLFPAFRSRISLRIIKSDACNHCGICEQRCPVKAIKNGVITKKCIRCLRCVANCPQKALRHQNSLVLSTYLNHYYRHCECTLYL